MKIKGFQNALVKNRNFQKSKSINTNNNNDRNEIKVKTFII